MAVSITNNPPLRHPAYNPAVFEFFSNTIQPNFRFYVELKDEDGNIMTNPIRLPKKPGTNIADINMSPFVRSFVNNEMTEQGVAKLESGLATYTVLVGEEYTYSWNYLDYEFNSSATIYNAYTKLVSSVPHTYVVGDQISVVQSDGGLLKPMLNGLFTVVEIPNANEIVINILFSVVGSGTAVPGKASYSDGRKIVVKGLAEIERVCYNGAFDSNIFVRTVDGTEFETIPRRFASNIKNGFRVIPNYNMWLNVLFFDSAPTYFDVISNSGCVLEHTFAKDGDSMQFYAGSDESMYTTSENTPLIKDSDTEVLISFGSGGGTISDELILSVYKDCPVDMIELMYCDRFGSYLPFYFRLVNEETTEAVREILTDQNGYDSIIGARKQRGWFMRSDNLNEVELELFDILLTSPDVRIKINGYYEKVIITTNSTQTARNSVKKRKEITVRLAIRDEVNV